jgi:hypothetical protein
MDELTPLARLDHVSGELAWRRAQRDARGRLLGRHRARRRLRPTAVPFDDSPVVA